MSFEEIDRTHLELVGGKGVNLGELSRLHGVRVPTGCCLTTDAFERIIGTNSAIGPSLDDLSLLGPTDREATGTISAAIRRIIEEIAIPDDVESEISEALDRLGGRLAYAVRSSATAEDSLTASFAGQHDSYLNVVGLPAVLDRVKQCWASLFTERAVAYRQRNDIDHRRACMAVVLQRMVSPTASGVMFTADPVSSDRTVVAVEAGVGLGEALVAGMIDPDRFKVRDGAVIDRTVHQVTTLTDEQVVSLASLGRRIESHFAAPQDVEWCLADDDFHVVQSRPITALFPIPSTGDDEKRVYVSVGHQQMMTDAITPLGLSVWQMTTPAPMAEAGGRLFVDVTARLAASSSRIDFLELTGRSDPLLRDALQTILDRETFITLLPDDGLAPPPAVDVTAQLDADPSIVRQLIEESEASIDACWQEIRTKSGPEVFDFIASDVQELRRALFDPRSHQVFMTAIVATWWINEHMLGWLGEKNAADALTQSVPHNVTSEMGLALLDLADVVRPHDDVVAFLGRVNGRVTGDAGDNDAFLDELVGVAGGAEVHDAFGRFLDRYGMRCAGEIDITRRRWSEQPSTLLPMILAHVRNVEPGEARRRFDEGRQMAKSKERELLERLRALPDGAAKASETAQMIDRVRTFMGYREYPKYAMVSRYFLYKRALMAEADRLVERGALRSSEDIFHLRFEEFHEVVRTGNVDQLLITQRKEAFHSYRTLRVPRVLTSDGEAVSGSYRRDGVPSGAHVGLAVSSGIVEGRARVVSDIASADLEPGDILVTAYTDPSWTPLFVTIAGLVTEVGGTMTHGAVIAREYGLPAVVSVARATELIEDGQRIRVNGTDGFVEIVRADGRRLSDDRGWVDSESAGGTALIRRKRD